MRKVKKDKEAKELNPKGYLKIIIKRMYLRRDIRKLATTFSRVLTPKKANNCYSSQAKLIASIPFTKKYSSSDSMKLLLLLTLLTGSIVYAAENNRISSCDADFKMPYRMLGNTGLQVSVLSYGFFASFGSKSDLKSVDGVSMAKECLRVAKDHGVNLFDNAEVYGSPSGEAERIMGIALKQVRISLLPTLTLFIAYIYFQIFV